MEEGGNAACTLLECLEEKYLYEDEAACFDQDIILCSYTGSSPCKMASKFELQLVVLNNMRIESLGDTARLHNLAKHVSEVDLAWNNISDWSVVNTLIDNIPHLRTLNLSYNPLKKQVDLRFPTTPRLDTLILNGTNLPLSSYLDIVNILTHLQELHISDNCDLDFDAIENVAPTTSSVEAVYANRCEITSWSTVARLLRLFTQLRMAFLYENPIKAIEYDSASQSMANLQVLNLGKTDIENWESIDNLEKFPSLTELRINNIPLLEEHNDEEKMHLIVGRLPLLQILNGSLITPEQREHSERFFIRHYMEHEKPPEQLKRLIERHGKLEQLVRVDLTPVTQASVKVICEETNYEGTIKVNLNKTIGQFMKFLEAATGVAADRMRLFHHSDEFRVEECRYPKMLLHTLRMEEGDYFTVHVKTATKRRTISQKSS